MPVAKCYWSIKPWLVFDAAIATIVADCYQTCYSSNASKPAFALWLYVPIPLALCATKLLLLALQQVAVLVALPSERALDSAKCYSSKNLLLSA